MKKSGQQYVVHARVKICNLPVEQFGHHILSTVIIQVHLINNLLELANQLIGSHYISTICLNVYIHYKNISELTNCRKTDYIVK